MSKHFQRLFKNIFLNFLWASNSSVLQSRNPSTTGLVFYNSPAYREGSEEHGVRRTSLFRTKDILGLSPEDFAQLALDIAALNLADDYETFMQNIDNENRARAIETYLDL